MFDIKIAFARPISPLTNRPTLLVSLAREARPAGADHDPGREVVHDGAVGVGVARLDRQAGVQAHAAEARHLAGAVDVGRALVIPDGSRRSYNKQGGKRNNERTKKFKKMTHQIFFQHPGRLG